MRNLKIIRSKRGLTQKHLAEMAGIDQGTISKIERNPDYNYTNEMIQKLSEALQVTAAELMGLPELQAKVLEALQAINDPERQAAALVVLESMASQSKK